MLNDIVRLATLYCPISKGGSSVVKALASSAKGPRVDPCWWRKKFRRANMHSLVPFGMTLDKCIILRIGMLTDVPCAGKVTPVQVKNPTVNLDIVTCRLSSCNLECT